MNPSVSQQASLQAHGGRLSAYSLKDVGLAAWKERGAIAGCVLASLVVQGTPYVEITSRSMVAEKAGPCLEAALVRVKASQIAKMNQVDSKHVHIQAMCEDGMTKRPQDIRQLRSVAGGTMIYVDSTSTNLVLLEKIENIKAYLATKEQRTNLFNRVPAVQRIYPDQHRSIVAGALSGLLLATA